MKGCLSNPFASNFRNQSIISTHYLLPSSTPSVERLHRYLVIQLLITNQVLFFLCYIVEFWPRCFLFAVVFCPAILSLPAHFIAEFYFHLHHMNMSILNLNAFSKKKIIIGNGPSLNHRWPKIGAMGSPWPLIGLLGMSWPSVNCTGVSIRARSGPDSKPYRFPTFARKCCFESFASFCRKIFWLNISFWFFMTWEK